MSKIPVFIIIRSTFDERVKPITLYWSKFESSSRGEYHEFTAIKADAEQYMTKFAARNALALLHPRQGNESIMEIEVEEMKVL